MCIPLSSLFYGNKNLTGLKWVNSDGNPKSKSARSRHNKRQLELYNKHKNAMKAQQAQQTGTNKAPGAAATPPKAGQ